MCNQVHICQVGIKSSECVCSVHGTETVTETHHNERNQNVEHNKDGDRRADVGLRLVQRHVGEHGLRAPDVKS